MRSLFELHDSSFEAETLNICLPHELPTGHELRLRQESDVPDFYRLTIMSLHRLRRCETWPAHYRYLDDEYHYVRHLMGALRLGSKVPLGIFDEGQPVGTLVAHLDVPQQTASLSYWLAGHATGKGAVTAGVRWLCHYLFAHRDIQDIEIHTISHNTRSQAVAQRCGFTPLDRDLEPVMLDGVAHDRVGYHLPAPSANKQDRH